MNESINQSINHGLYSTTNCKQIWGA